MKKLFNLILIIILIVIGLGLNTVEVSAEAGSLNKSRTLVNLMPNGDFSVDSDSDGLADGFTDTGGIISPNILDGQYFENDGALNRYIRSDFYTLNTTDVFYYVIEVNAPAVRTGIVNFSGSLMTVTYTDVGSFEVLSYYGNLGYSSDVYSQFRIGYDSSAGSYTFKNFMFFNLTELYGAGNEPTQAEFEAILDEAPEYFEEWTYNYYEEDSSIGEFACERTFDNLLENGDFESDLTSWASTRCDMTWDNGVLKCVSNDVSPYPRGNIFVSYDNHYYYFYIDFYLNGYDNFNIVFRDGVGQNAVLYTYNNTELEWHNESYLYKNVRGGYTSSYVAYQGWSTTVGDELYLDNAMVLDLTAIYGAGNEPTQEWVDGIIEREGIEYFDTLVIDDTFYATVEQTSPVYQYYSNAEGINARLDLTLTDTILEMDVVNPLLYVVKYDLDMNYEGIIYDGNISTTGTNAEGYTTHSIELDLPSPVTGEEGYIYVAYDESGGNVLGGGYVFASTSSDFIDYNVVGINNSPYVENATGNQFSGEYEDYMFNDYITIHSVVDSINYSGAELVFYSENTNQITTFDDYINIYEDNCDVAYRLTSPVAYECVFYASSGDVLPPFFEFLQNNTLYADELIDSLDRYTTSYTNLLYDSGYADNGGVYTYAYEIGGSAVAIGETPLYNFDTFHSMSIVSHQIRNGRNLFLDITKDNTYLDDVYDRQFLFDNNTGIYDFDIEDDIDQRIILEVFDGLSPDDATVYYNLNRVDSFTNGADNDYYDIALTDSYVMTSALPFPDKVDNFMEDIGMNSVFGKMMIASITLILVTVGMFVSTKNIIATLIVDFIVIALLTVLGIIPLWVVLFVIMLLFGGLFIRKRGN